jgi:TonB family protein
MTLSPFNSGKGLSSEGLWTKMVPISVGMHLLILALLLNVLPKGNGVMKLEPAYMVDLVSPPGGGASGEKMDKAPAAPSPPQAPAQPASKKAEPAKKEESRILKPVPQPQPIPVPKPIPEKPQPVKEDLSKNLDQALEKLKKKVQQEQSLENTLTHLEKKVKQDKSLESALSRLEKKVQAGQGSGKTVARTDNKAPSSSEGASGTGVTGAGSIASSNPGASEGVGIQFQLYNASLRSQIKKNWGLPEELLKRKDISAEILIKIGRNGHLEDSRFQRKSGVEAFDQEVLRTLKKSEPFPSLPDGYPKSTYDVILTFHSKELSGK